MYVFFVKHVRYIIMYVFRLIKEITRCKYERLKGRDVEAPVLTKEELKNRKDNLLPTLLAKKVCGCPSQGSGSIHGWHHEGCQLASYPCPVGDPPAPGYTAAKKNKRRP